MELRKIRDGAEGDQSRDVFETDLAPEDQEGWDQGVANALDRHEGGFRRRVRVTRRVAEAMGFPIPAEEPSAGGPAA